MIQMISGVYGAREGMKRASDGPFSLSDKEEARLVNRGVAKYVYEHQPAASDDVPIIPHYDMSMTDKQLRGIAAYFCVDVKSAKKKQEIIDLLDAHFAGDGDTEEDTEDDQTPGNTDGDTEDDQTPGDSDVVSDSPVLGAATPTA